MNGPITDLNRIRRFATFEFDTRSRELRKGGVKVRLPDQAAKVLAALLNQPGDVVTREDLVALLWPDGTHVDFEMGLNGAVKRLRQALDDSGDAPRYIETLPRRGYRLIAPVASPEAERGAVPALPPAAPAGSASTPRRRRGTALVVATSVVVLAGLFVTMSWRGTAEPTRPASGGQGRPSANADANGYFAKAQLFAGAGLHDVRRARELMERALSLDPAFGKARAEYGFSTFILVLAGHTNDASSIYRAEQDIERGLTDDPTFSHGEAARAALLLFHGKKEQSRRHAETALTMNPNDIDARHWLAVSWWMAGQNQRARSLEQENLTRQPRFFPAHETLGELARESGDWAGSISEHSQVLEYDTQNNFVLQALARTYMQSGNLPLAGQTLDRLRPEDRLSFRTRALESLLFALEDQRDRALKALDADVLKYLDLNGFDTLTAAEIYALLGDVPTAIAWVEKAVRNGDERANWFTHDSFLARLQNIPRFREIVASVARHQDR